MGLYAVRVIPCHEYYLKSNDFRYKFLLKIKKHENQKQSTQSKLVTKVLTQDMYMEIT